jgi:hypothetical protein
MKTHPDIPTSNCVQITLGALFRSILFAAVCISWWTVPREFLALPIELVWFLNSCACGGAAIGTLFERTGGGIVIGLILGLIASSIAIFRPAVQ